MNDNPQNTFRKRIRQKGKKYALLPFDRAGKYISKAAMRMPLAAGVIDRNSSLGRRAQAAFFFAKTGTNHSMKISPIRS
ncbi:MAG: hypothetical protein ACI4SG_01880 [Oligosphaeraceae bacterium]